MGVPSEDFKWTVEDVAEEIRNTHPGFEDLQAAWIGSGRWWP
jgi:hypothetical protein